MKILAAVLFILMYVVIIGFPAKKLWAAWGTAVLFLITGILPLREIIPAINWNVLMMISGTMMIVYYFIESRMPNRIADELLAVSRNVMWVTIYMSLFAGAISAFIDNVATVLMVAPVGLVICRKLNISPVPMILSIAVSSNLQGAATLVGDTTSILLGAYAGMDFMSFFWMNGRPGIFFAVELGAAATVPIMMYLFRRDRDPVDAAEKTAVSDRIPTYLLCGMVFTLIAASFLKNKPELTNGIICLAFAVIAALQDSIRHREPGKIREALRSIDTETLLLLTGLFLVIEGITEAGLIDVIAGKIAQAGGSSLFVLYTIIVWGSVAASAFVDNIPYVATMLPVLRAVTTSLGIPPYLLYFGLLTGATLGGNLTPVGASANITAVGMLRREGWDVSFRDFARVGIPFTLTAVLVGYLFLWIVWR